ncbi:MAG: hypothetical protein IPI59_05235 [Sphingobacteriales bacterium]|nr:hypothetical protein [Sphingobacteriales bacterium]
MEETVSRFSSLAAQLPSFEKVEYNGGRIEKTHLYGAKSIVFVDSAAKFKDCQSIIRIIAERTLKNQPEKTTQEVRYYLTSLDISPQNALTICRNHRVLKTTYTGCSMLSLMKTIIVAEPNMLLKTLLLSEK